MQFDDIMTLQADTSTNKRKVVLVDGHNIANIALYASMCPEYTEGDFSEWRNVFFNMLFYDINDLSPDELVVVFDSKNSWRYDIYPEYKANRKKNKGSYAIDKQKFNEAVSDMAADLSNIFPNILTIKSPRAEGDDILAVLAREVYNTDRYDVVIVSRDADMHQLTAQANVSQYHPHDHTIFEILNPKKLLELKIIGGDNSDNIKGINTRVGIKTAIKIMNEGLDVYIGKQDTELKRNRIQANYELNSKLIDLSLIPINIKEEILENYNKYTPRPLVMATVMKFFIKTKLRHQYRNWKRNSIAIKAIGV